LLYLSRRRGVQRFVSGNPIAFRAASRFVAGSTLEEALAVARDLNARGIEVSLDHLGENVTAVADARQATEDYLAAFERIARGNLRANVSVKLTQLGLDVDEALCRSLLEQIVRRADHLHNFVRVDMEGSAYTQRTLDIVSATHARCPSVGVVVQAYLYRTPADVERAIAARMRIRLCKGAYDEPPSIAHPSKAATDASYVQLMQRLLEAGNYPAIATHDEAIIGATTAHARAHQIAPDRFEFQMLYGIRRDLQVRLVREGWRLRVYVPYGTQWYAYLMRRLAERPANLLFLVRNLTR
jgi:proline dehydrogenase